MKRSAQIGLVVMGALGVTVASGYWLDARCDRQAKNDPQASPDRSCRHTSSGWHSTYGGGHGSAPATKPSSSPGTPTPARGGFGSTGKGAGGGS
jgi:hypothetical protein